MASADQSPPFTSTSGRIARISTSGCEVRLRRVAEAGLGDMTHAIGRAIPGTTIAIQRAGSDLYRASRVDLHRAWAELSFTMQGLREIGRAHV